LGVYLSGSAELTQLLLVAEESELAGRTFASGAVSSIFFEDPKKPKNPTALFVRMIIQQQ
jgi:hypothetical protein